MFQASKYDWSSSDGLFHEIVGKSDPNEWVEKCNEILDKITLAQPVLQEFEESPGDCTNGPLAEPETSIANDVDGKRKESSTPKGQDTATSGKNICKPSDVLPKQEIEFQNRTSACEIGRCL